LRFGVISL